MVTEDDYILSVFRIPDKKGSQPILLPGRIRTPRQENWRRAFFTWSLFFVGFLKPTMRLLAEDIDHPLPNICAIDPIATLATLSDDVFLCPEV